MVELNEQLAQNIITLTNHQRETSIMATKHEPVLHASGKNYLLDQVFKDNYKNFPAIPKVRNATTISTWRLEIMDYVGTAPWALKNGTSIFGDQPTSICESEDYKGRVTRLATILHSLLDDAGLDGVKSVLRRDNAPLQDGTKLIHSIISELVPITATDILTVCDDLANCLHENGESVEAFETRIVHIFDRFTQAGCVTMDDLKLAFLQRGFLNGAYSEHDALKYLKDRLANNNANLNEWKTPGAFCRHMQGLFKAKGMIKDGQLQKVATGIIRKMVQ